MEARSIKRLGLVVLLAAVGVWLISTLGGPGRESQGPATRVEEGDRPPQLDRDAEPGETLDPTRLGTSERSVIQRTNPETGELQQEFSYKELTPQEEGVFRVTEPRGRLYLAPWRVIHLRSDRGRIVAPENHPQSGTFRGNVAITVYESSRGRSVDLAPDSPDRLVRMLVDRARFDTTLGQVTSDSEVRVVSPGSDRLRFRGKGMKLVYDQINSRIEYLRIDQGRSARYQPPEQETEDDTAGSRDTEGETGGGESETPPQYYRVTFEKNVHLTQGGRAVDAQRMEVLFAMDRQGGDGPSDAQPGETQSSAAAPALPGSAMLGGVAPNPLPWLVAAADERADASPAPGGGDGAVGKTALMPAGSEPIHLEWDGRMIMRPVEQPPEKLAGRDDVFVRFEGKPVTVTLDEQRRMRCRSVAYLRSAHRLVAAGSPAHPLRIAAPRIGTIGAERLTMDLEANTARLHGAGRIASAEQTADGADDATRVEGLPAGLSIAWSDHLALTFAEGEGTDRRIDTAAFHGDVRVNDPRFELTGRRLSAHFAPPKQPEADPRLTRLDAEGAVRVRMDEGRVRADRLRLETSPTASGELRPDRMEARGNVELVEPDRKIAAERLDVTLAAKKTTDDALRPQQGGEGGTDAGKSDQPMEDVAVRTVRAREDVRLTMRGDTHVRADRLDADARAGTATLIGSPVIVTRAGGEEEAEGAQPPRSELRVARLRIEDDGRLAHGEGEGAFLYTEPAGASEGGSRRRVKVTWQKRMRFDDEAATIQVFGDVRAEAQDAPDELNRLTAERMTLELIDPDAIAATGPEDGGEPSSSGPDVSGLGRHRLKRLRARKSVVLLATRWASADRERVLTRFRLAGPKLTFRNVDRVAKVRGGGSMLIEDYRSSDGDAERAAKNGGGAKLELSGRGATLFTWSDRLTLDDNDSDLRIRGDVRMTHRPAGDGELIELQSQRLLADMTSEKGVRALGMTRSGDLRIRRVEATEAVQVRQGNRMVSAGHLLYTAADRTITLRAGDRGRVTIARLDKPKPVRARRVRWDLANDEIEVLEAGG